MDTLTRAERSERMARVRGKNTTPELVVRRAVHGLGFRYRLHGRGLPGKPDLVFRKARKLIFVHGCFWHRHAAASCRLARLPKSRLGFWKPKLQANHLRDVRNVATLRGDGWRVLIVWECQLSNKARLRRRLKTFLGRP